jgi:hypothetical protein
MNKKLLMLSCLLPCGAMLAMEPNDFTSMLSKILLRQVAERTNSSQISQDAAFTRELQRQLNAEENASSNRLSQDEAYARELERQLNGEGNAPVAERGRRAPVVRPSSKQLSQDEAYALELQRQLNGEVNAPVA